MEDSQSTERGGLPALRVGASPEVFRNVPTLVGAEYPGEHGPVRVWGPNRALAQRRKRSRTAWLVASAPLSAAGLYLAYFLVTLPIHFGSGVLGFILAVLFGGSAGFLGVMPLMLAWILLLKNRVANRIGWSYIALDSAGISLTTKAQSRDAGLSIDWGDEGRSIAWDDIVVLETGRHSLGLYTRSGEMLAGTLRDYDAQAAQELGAIIRERANLQPSEIMDWTNEEARNAADAIDRGHKARTDALYQWAYGRWARWLPRPSQRRFFGLLGRRRTSVRTLQRRLKKIRRNYRIDCRPGYHLKLLFGVIADDPSLNPTHQAALPAAAPSPHDG